MARPLAGFEAKSLAWLLSIISRNHNHTRRNHNHYKTWHGAVNSRSMTDLSVSVNFSISRNNFLNSRTCWKNDIFLTYIYIWAANASPLLRTFIYPLAILLTFTMSNTSTTYGEHCMKRLCILRTRVFPICSSRHLGLAVPLLQPPAPTVPRTEI